MIDNKNHIAGCSGKGKYDKKTAQTLVNRLKKYGQKLKIYPCDNCNSWHLTKSRIFVKQ